jgi:hypothetical protein
MVCNIQTHWLSGLCPSFGILNTRKHNVSENESSCISVFPSPETLCFLVSRIPDDGQSPETPSVIHHGQNPLESEENKITREVNELVPTTRANNQATA